MLWFNVVGFGGVFWWGNYNVVGFFWVVWWRSGVVCCRKLKQEVHTMNKRNNTMTSFYKAQESMFPDNEHKQESVIAKTSKESERRRTRQAYAEKVVKGTL